MSEEKVQELPKGREISMEEYARFKKQYDESTEKIKATVNGSTFDFAAFYRWLRKYSKAGKYFATKSVVLDDGSASTALVIVNDLGDVIGAFEFGSPCPPFCW